MLVVAAGVSDGLTVVVSVLAESSHERLNSLTLDAADVNERLIDPSTSQ